MKKKNNVRVRFAPSPTGPFTIGNARTAIYNWLYARHHGGEFLLRIEDTDKKRSEKKFEDSILKGLDWLGLDWDGKMVRQSERGEVYKDYLNNLLKNNKAYYCFCSKEEIEKERGAQAGKGLAPKYSGKCSEVSLKDAKKRVESGDDFVLRFRMSEKNIGFKDLVRGSVEFDGSLIGDFVIAKDLDAPLYNLAVVIDDNDMEITHVIRGEDHISNTPKQIAIREALGFDEVEFAHLPLILSPGGGKLSKREMHRSILDYKKDGYLSEAVFNFLLLIGWHPEKDREVVTKDEAVKEFSIERVQKSGGAFNEEKLNWYNSHYISKKSVDELIKDVKDFVPADWLKEGVIEFTKKILEVEKDRMKNLIEFKELAGIFFNLPDYEDDLLIWKDKKEESKKSLEELYKFLEKLPNNNWTEESIKLFMEDLSEKFGGRGAVYWPLRVALSGKKSSPGATEMAFVLGKKETLNRVNIAIKKINL